MTKTCNQHTFFAQITHFVFFVAKKKKKDNKRDNKTDESKNSYVV